MISSSVMGVGMLRDMETAQSRQKYGATKHETDQNFIKITK